MAHVRAQIRDAVAVLLGSLGATVKKSRAWPVSDASLPMMLVYTSNEASRYHTTGSTLWRELTLNVKVLAKDVTDTLDDTLDDFAALVEAALASKTYSGLAIDTVLSSTDTNLDTSGELPVGVVKLVFSVTYRTAANDATVAKG